MAGHFVIDINVRDGGRAGGAGIAAAGVLAHKSLSSQDRFLLPGKTGTEDAIPYKGDDEWYSKKRYAKENLEDDGWGGYGGQLHAFGTRRTIGGEGLVKGGLQEQETLLGYGVRTTGEYVKAHQKQIKGLGVATAWKTANAMIDTINYTSGDKASNHKRAQSMRLGTYGAAIAYSGGSPFVVAGIVGNELINIGLDAYKYNYDRKMERAEIANSEMVLGDISYGRRRGGR